MGEKICQLRDITHKSYSLADEIFHAYDAENWGNGSIISDELVKNAKNFLEVSMRDLTAVTSRRQKELSPSRLNRQRVKEWKHL